MIYAQGTDHKDDAERHASAAKKEGIDEKRFVEKEKARLELKELALKEHKMFSDSEREEEKVEKERMAEYKDEFIGKLDDVVYLPTGSPDMVVSYKKGNKDFVKGNTVYRTPTMSVLEGEEAVMFQHLFA